MRKKNIIEVTDKPMVPEKVISQVKGEDCGAIVTFTGKVRGRSEGKQVNYLEHDLRGRDPGGTLGEIVGEIRAKWEVGDIAFCYRRGRIKANEVTIVIAIAAVHRQEAFAACQYAVDRLKQVVVTREGREDGEVHVTKKG